MLLLDEMKSEIGHINWDLCNTPADEKATSIQRWIERVLERIEHFKSEHHILLKEAIALLELALWKSKIDEFKLEKVSSEDNTTARKPGLI